MKSCQDYELMIHLYLDDELSKADQAELLEHLAHCEPCRQLCEDYRLIAGEIRAMPGGDPPPSLHADIMNHIAANTARRSRPRVWRRAWGLVACAAVLALVLVAGDTPIAPAIQNQVTGGGDARARADVAPAQTAQALVGDTPETEVEMGDALSFGLETSSPLADAPTEKQQTSEALDTANGEAALLNSAPYTPRETLAISRTFNSCFAAVGDLAQLPELLAPDDSLLLNSDAAGVPQYIVVASGDGDAPEGALTTVIAQLTQAGFEIFSNLQGEAYQGNPDAADWLIVLEAAQ